MLTDARVRGWSFLFGSLLLASCHPGTRPPSAVNGATYPRCLASDPYGNQVTCAAPPRTFDGDRCACAGTASSDTPGLVYFGRVQEYPRPPAASPGAPTTGAPSP